MDSLAKILIVGVLIIVAPFAIFWVSCFGLASIRCVVFGIFDRQWGELIAIAIVMIIAIVWHTHTLRLTDEASDE